MARPKPLLLLAYLALEGPQERRHLAELFWGGATDPFNRLAVTLARLRGTDPALLSADNVRVWTPVACDAAELLDALDKGASGGMDLYRGPFLEGFYLKDAGAELEEWVYATREKIAGRVRTAQLRLAETVAAQGSFVEAAKLAERAYALPGAADPDIEELLTVYRLLVAGSSNLTGEVKKEGQGFGIRFALTLAEAQQQLAEKARTTPHNLTPQPTAFVGRSAEMAALSRGLCDPDCRLLTITGPGGVGKTRLALEVA